MQRVAEGMMNLFAFQIAGIGIQIPESGIFDDSRHKYQVFVKL